MKICLILTVLSFIQWLEAYNPVNADLSVDISEGNIIFKLLDGSKVKSAHIVIEDCPNCQPGYFVRPSESVSIDINKLSKPDVVKIRGIYETSDQVTTKISEYKIGKQETVSVTDSSDCCVQSETIVNGESQKCSGTEIFAEDFTDDKLSQFSYDVRSMIGLDEPEMVAYVKDKENVNVENGLLYINITQFTNKKSLKDCTSKITKPINPCGPFKNLVPKFKSGRLYSTFSFKYGRIHMRLKLPRADFVFPYLILQPANTNFDTPFVDHIRLAYNHGNEVLQDRDNRNMHRNIVFSSVITHETDAPNVFQRLKQGKTYQKYKVSKLCDNSNEFHDYTIIWHKNKMIFKIDDKEYGRITDKQIMDKINKNEHFLVLALTVGGDLNFNDGEILRAHKEAIFSNSEPNHHIKFFEAIHLWKDWKDPSLVIDYIRIFTTNESEE